MGSLGAAYLDGIQLVPELHITYENNLVLRSSYFITFAHTSTLNTRAKHTHHKTRHH